MIKKTKRNATANTEEPAVKKVKKENKSAIKDGTTKKQPGKKVSFSKKVDISSPKKNTKPSNNQQNKFNNGKPPPKNQQTPVTDWVAFKKQKKELAIKRKQSKGSYDIIMKTKKIGEKIRRKALKGGEEERTKLIIKLHEDLKGKGNYAKFVLTHDVGRVVQYLLKYGPETVKDEITKV